MGNKHDSIALDWVRGEIEQTLTQGQQALEAYVENRDDTARLRFCLNRICYLYPILTGQRKPLPVLPVPAGPCAPQRWTGRPVPTLSAAHQCR